MSLLYLDRQLDDGIARVTDAGAVRRRLHAAQAIHGPQHGRRCDSRSVAPDSGLDGLRRGAGLGGLFAVFRVIRLAVSPLPGDRLAVPTRLCRGRAANVAGRNALPDDRPRSVAGFLACGYAAVLVPVSLLPGAVGARRRTLPRGGAFVGAWVIWRRPCGFACTNRGRRPADCCIRRSFTCRPYWPCSPGTICGY